MTDKNPAPLDDSWDQNAWLVDNDKYLRVNKVLNSRDSSSGRSVYERIGVVQSVSLYGSASSSSKGIRFFALLVFDPTTLSQSRVLVDWSLYTFKKVSGDSNMFRETGASTTWKKAGKENVSDFFFFF